MLYFRSPISRFTRFPDHPIFRSPINQSSDQPMMPSLPLIPRSKGLSRNIPLVSRSPGSPERGGFACAGAQPPSAVGLLENRISYSRSTDHPISRSPDHPISRSPDFRNVPRSYHTSITRQSNLKFSHQPRRLSSTEVGPTARERRSGAIPSCPPLTCRTEASSTRTMEFGFGFGFGFWFGYWFGFGFWFWFGFGFGFCQLPLANC
jgi:hypothetical protein